MFRRRLGNYLLKLMWKMQHQPADLYTYIRNRRQEDDEELELPKTMEQPLTFQVTEQPFQQDVVDRDERALNPDEILQLTEEMVLEDPKPAKVPSPPQPIKQVSPPRGRPSRSWISPFLKKHELTLQDSFSALDFRGNQALGRDQLKDLFRETLGICEVELQPQYLDSFGAMVEERCGARTMLSFPAFVGLVEDWALRTPVRSADFAAQLRKTIQEYEDMMENFGGPSAATRSVETLIASLKAQLSSYLSKKDAQKGGKSLEAVQNAALAEIFSYYAKHIRLIGTTPTFDEITANNNLWTIGKFFKFCADKDLMGKQTATKRRLAKEEIMLIFKKNAALTRNMELSHFKAALDDVAAMYYDQQYDEIEANKGDHQPVATESVEQKRKRLYRELKLGEATESRKNGSRTGRKPSLEPQPAHNISEDGIRRPRFRLPKDTKSKLDEIKAQKVTKSVDPRPLRPPKPIEVTNIPVKPQAGYSQRHVVVKNISAEPLSWQNLSKMHPSELASEEDLRNVIGDEGDDSPVSGNRISKEMREKARRLGPQAQARDDARMDQMMRQLDRKVESGYKVLQRSKAPA